MVAVLRGFERTGNALLVTNMLEVQRFILDLCWFCIELCSSVYVGHEARLLI